MEIKNQSAKIQIKEKQYIRKPLDFTIPDMNNMQCRKNPFTKSARSGTFNTSRIKTLSSITNNGHNVKAHTLDMPLSSGVPRPNFIPMPRRSSTISEACESVTEESCGWVFEEPIKTETEGKFEEYKDQNSEALELTPEIQYNFNAMRHIVEATPEEIISREVVLKPNNKKSAKTLVLDLDDTLIHTINPLFNYSALNISYGRAQTVLYKNNESPSFEAIKVIIRPYALKFITELSSLYEIIVFYILFIDIYSRSKLLC